MPCASKRAALAACAGSTSAALVLRNCLASISNCLNVVFSSFNAALKASVGVPSGLISVDTGLLPISLLAALKTLPI